MPLPNYYFPAGYQPMQMQNQPMVNQSTSQAQSTNVIWVQGENAAKSYPVASGNSVLLLDSEASVMYIKSTDQSGMPLPLRIFDYSERDNPSHSAALAKSNEYVSRAEFDAFREDITKSIKGIRNPVKAGESHEPVV